MNQTLVEALRLEVQSIWIHKAQYVDAERRYRIAVDQPHREDQIPEPVERKNKSKKKKSSKVQQIEIELTKLVGTTSREALQLVNHSMYADAERRMVIGTTKQKQEEKRAPKPKKKKNKSANKVTALKPIQNQNPRYYQRQKYGLTPYQGNSRCFGEYECGQCYRRWMSGYSWADMGQQCIRCNQNIYPYRQHPLELIENKSSGYDGVSRHDTEKCEKCQNVKGDCRNYDRNGRFRGSNRRSQWI